MKTKILFVVLTLTGLTFSQLAAAAAPESPKQFRVDISVGTTGQLFISWNDVKDATYFNLFRSKSRDSGYVSVGACSGPNNQYTQTQTAMKACRDKGLTVGKTYYYKVQACNADGCSALDQAPISNLPVSSNCTNTPDGQIPDLTGRHTHATISLLSTTVDPAIEFLPTNDQYAGYASLDAPSRKNLLVVMLPGSGGSCSAGGAFGNTAQKLGYDTICVNYSNKRAQHTICDGDPDCFGNITQAKLDATGPCSQPNGPHCGKDPDAGGDPYVLSNPADAVTRRITKMLQYLNNNGFNAYGTNWGDYLSGNQPRWDKIVIGGHSQGSDMGVFAAYKHIVNRVYILSGPPQATPVNGVMTAATYMSDKKHPKQTNISNFYGLVSFNDPLYAMGVFAAVWPAFGFTEANHDGETKLNVSGHEIGLDCNPNTESHNFSTFAPKSVGGGHNDTIYLWNEDVYKFMLN